MYCTTWEQWYLQTEATNQRSPAENYLQASSRNEQKLKWSFFLRGKNPLYIKGRDPTLLGLSWSSCGICFIGLKCRTRAGSTIGVSFMKFIYREWTSALGDREILLQNLKRMLIAYQFWKTIPYCNFSLHSFNFSLPADSRKVTRYKIWKCFLI